jgi:hypothetical protein
VAKKIYKRPPKKKYTKMEAEDYPPKYKTYHRPRKRRKGVK